MLDAVRGLIPPVWRKRLRSWVPRRYVRLSNLYTAPGYPRKRALLSYITAPWRQSSDDSGNMRYNTNLGLARNIVRALNELGYAMDVIDYWDKGFRPRSAYDLLIVHGGANPRQIAARLSPSTPMICFSTGLYWREWNQQEAKRFDALFLRRGVRLPPDRHIFDSEQWANEHADGIICLGNAVARDSYARFPLVIPINNAAYPDDHYDRTPKDFAAARDGFLYFAGAGNVHKGLDLLLEAFADLAEHLYICQGLQEGFEGVYRHELHDLPNVHFVGRIPMRSCAFFELVERCNCVILPSCGEGQPGSVIECMHQGLIPIVSRESNIDTEDFGITLPSCTTDDIKRVVGDVAQRPIGWHEAMSRVTRQAAITDYTEEAFVRNVKAAITSILESINGG